MEILFWITLGVASGFAFGGLLFHHRRNRTIESRVAELSDAREYSEALIEKTPNGFIVLDEDLTIVQVNEAYCRMTGRSREELVGLRPPHPGWAPEEREMLREHGRRISRGECEPFEVSYVKKSGERFPGRYNPGIIRTQRGKRYFFAIVEDLTERRRHEETLTESEAMFRRIAETSTDAIYQLDLNGKIIYCSPAVERVLDYTSEEFVGTEFRAHFLPEDLRAAEESFERNLRGEEVRNTELRILNKAKQPVHIEVNATRIQKDGKTIGSQGVAHDITERKAAERALRESEAKLKTQFKGLPIPVYAWQRIDDDFVLIDFNDAAERITEGQIVGYKGVKASDLYRDDPDIIEELRRCFDEKKFIQREMLYRYKSTGKVKYMSVSYGYAPPDLVMVHTEDVTARKEIEDMLRASEARLRTVLESVPFHLLLIDENGRYAMQNAASEEGWGDVTGKRPQDVAPDGDTLALWLENNQRALAGEVVEGEVSFKVKGEERHFYNIISPVYDRGSVRGILVVNVDITERKLAEKALKESEEKYRFLVENTGSAVSLWDRDGRLMLMNRIGAGYLNATPEELIGKTPHDLSGEEVADGVMEKFRAVLESGLGMQTEVAVDTAMGRRWFRSFYQPVKDAEGRYFGVQVVAHDTTELVRAEKSLRDRDARLRLMVSQLPAVLWTVDLGLRFTSSTGTGLTALELRPGEVVGKALSDFFGTDDPEFLPIAMHRKSLAGEPTTYEMRWKGRVWETHTEPLRNETGEIIGCLAMAMDVTERRLAEEELRHSREQLRALAGRLHEVREEQSASVAREIHDELAQDLTAIKFDLAFIEKRLEYCEDPTEKARLEDKIGAMYKEIDAAIDLVRNIATRLRPPILDELGLVEAIELHAQDFQRRTGVQCDVNLYNVGATGLEQDMQRKTAVFRIFQEILTNVNRHAKATHVWVDLRREDETFILEVRDNGEGIPPEKMRNLDGLGILGMRERAQVFGGHVAIDSEVGKGTSVRLTIPLAEFA